jgi:hypothetical protein
VVLRDGEGAEGVVEGPARAGEALLDAKEVAEVDPNAGHLEGEEGGMGEGWDFVEENEAALERVVEGLPCGVVEAEAVDAGHALFEVQPPDFVGAWDCFEGTLVVVRWKERMG